MKNFTNEGRGLDELQIDALKAADSREGFLHGILEELRSPGTEIFLGIRNGYFNLYVAGASIGKFEFDGGEISTVELHKKYLGERLSGYAKLPLESLPYGFRQIRDNVKRFHAQIATSADLEKKFQQRLVLANNFSASSWFCTDMEYAQSKSSGRADIIAISRRPIAGKFRLLIIELKVGAGSFDTPSSKMPAEKFTPETFDGRNFGSGILGHFSDFVTMAADKNLFARLRGETVTILKNYLALGILPDDMRDAASSMTASDISDEPQFVFLIYGGAAAERSFRQYVGGGARKNLGGRESRCSVVRAWDENFVREFFGEYVRCVFRAGDSLDAIKDTQPLFADENISEATEIF